MCDLHGSPSKLVHVDAIVNDISDKADSGIALVKPDGSAWISATSPCEVSFRWQTVVASDPL